MELSGHRSMIPMLGKLDKFTVLRNAEAMPNREKIYRILNEANSLGGWIYRGVLTFLIFVVCVTFVWETYPIAPATYDFLMKVDLAITIIFLIDYLVRFWSERFSIRYLFTPLALVDLLAILPLFLSAHFQFIRVLRLLRILRLLRVLQREKPSSFLPSEFRLRVVTIFFTLFCIIFIYAGMIYEIEHKVNPIQIRTFFDSLYFSVVSVTTVGYGDIVPLSWQGRVATLLMICSGVILIPWQVTELARYLVQGIQKEERQCKTCKANWHDTDAKFCRRCGKPLAAQGD